MDLYNLLDEIITKRPYKGHDRELDKPVTAYILNRFLSMDSSVDIALKINDTGNVYSNVFPDINDYINFLKAVVPQKKYKNIKWISPPKKDSKKEDDVDKINIWAKSLEISQKEIKQYVDFLSTIT